MSPRQLVIKLLDRLECSNAYADLLLNKVLTKLGLSEVDKSLIQEIFLGVIRWRNRLDWIIKNIYRGSIEKAPRFIRYILQIGLYQLLFMDKIPAYAAIDETVKLAKQKGGPYWARKVNAILRSFQRNANQISFPDLSTNPVKHISVYYSHPEWLVARWINRFGITETISLCEENNSNPVLSLRANSLKISAQELQNHLSHFNLLSTRSTNVDYFILTKSLPDLNQFQPFQQGLFSIQDVSAGLACLLLNPEPGDKIVDLCAAPGGKTTFLAELTNDQASILAIDLNKSRLKLIWQNLNRLGLQSVQLVQGDGTQLVCKEVDKVIVDAPCSGLGVLSKRVDLRWKRTPEQIDELTDLQSRLLNNAANMVKPEGVIVYCTCTIEPAENEYIVEKFLHENKNFHLDPASNYVPEQVTNSYGYVYTFPHRHKMDGSFSARLVHG